MSDKILERVRLLLDKAEHVNTPAPEAELALKMANSLMAKHAIDEAIIRAGQTSSQRRAPSSTVIKLGENGTAEFWPVLRGIINDIAATNRCTGVISFNSVKLYGMAEDLSWTEMLFTTTYMQFVRELNPKWDESLGYDHNVYNYKVAGYKWKQIDEFAILMGHPSRESLTDGKPNGFYHKLKAAYVRHAKLVGDTNRVTTQSHSEYRRQFAEAFAHRISMRLWEMRKASQAETDSTPGAALALVTMSEDVREAMYAEYPHMRPETKEAREARHLKERQAREDMLNAMTPLQRQKFHEKEQREMRRERERNSKAWAKQSERYSDSAHRRGRAAADTVDLSRKTYTDPAPKRGEIN